MKIYTTGFSISIWTLSLVLTCLLPVGGSATTFLDASLPTPDNMVRPSPAEGSISATNPPSFVWLPETDARTYDLQYSRDAGFPRQATIHTSGVKYNLYHPSETMESGKWHWRYRAVYQNGTTSPWSSVRSFTVPEDAVEFTLPPMDTVMKRLPKGHPRLFVRPEDLQAFRESRFEERKELWKELEKRIEVDLRKPLMREPVQPGAALNPDVWRNLLVTVRTTAESIENLAFGYLITGDRKYADAAKRHVMTFCDWNAAGPTSFNGNSETAMSILLSTTRAYDWIYDTLTPEERRRIRETIRIRGGDIRQMFRNRRYESRPFESHPTRASIFLGQTAIVFLGEIDEAEEWFEYTASLFYCIYPPWGDTDGSYHEGPGYWHSHVTWVLQYAQALQTATGIDLHRKPWFRNTGYWLLYCTPPYSAMSCFGEMQYRPPIIDHKRNLYRLSALYQDPYLRWYSDNFPGRFNTDFTTYLWHGDSLKSKPVSDLPPSRSFPDAGYVAMHSELGNARDDIFLLLKSDPLGSVSHSYAEQNSFYLQAFGEALAISSGYYPYYNSPHHKGWTRQTRAHNSILVNGEGQGFDSMSAKGRIAETLFSPKFDYARGDASQAYEGKLDKFDRHVLFIRPGYFVMIDQLVTKEPSSFDWLLHSWERMSMDEQTNRASIRRGDARLLVKWIEPEKLTFSQTDQFTAPPENPEFKNQWHLTVSTPDRTREKTFVTVLYPYKAGRESSIPEIERAEASGAVGVSVSAGTRRHTVYVKNGRSDISAADFRSDAGIAAIRETGGKPEAIFMQGGRSISTGSESVSSDTPITLAMEWTGYGRSMTVRSDRAAGLRIRVPGFGAGSVKIDDKLIPAGQYSYTELGGILTFDVSPGEHTVEIRLGERT